MEDAEKKWIYPEVIAPVRPDCDRRAKNSASLLRSLRELGDFRDCQARKTFASGHLANAIALALVPTFVSVLNELPVQKPERGQRSP